MRKLIFISSFIFFAALHVYAQDGNDQQKMFIMMKMSSLRNALLSKDSAALSVLLADDVTYGHTNGLVQTKQQLIHDVMSGVQEYKSINPINIDVRIFDNTAIVNMTGDVSMLGILSGR